MHQYLDAWSIRPVHISPLTSGTNNTSWLVQTEEGEEYVLRITPGRHNVSRILYEIQLLIKLAKQQLSFSLPVPLSTHTGEHLLHDGTALVALMRRLPGKGSGAPTERHHLPLVRAAGVALAQLDSALATLDLPAPEQTAFGDFAHAYPLVPDPLAALKRLPLEPEQSNRLRALLTDIMERTPGLYQRLPQQLLHRDYDPANILVQGNQVTAVLDFEFAGTDLRVLDLCVALSWWPVYLMGSEQEWEVIDAFGRAYTAHLPLHKDELLVPPDVLRLRDAASLIHRIGRYLAGL
ncbi:Ser/Thr protein kinase RdoA (MazF antagonist) [Thermosporothrix hazakensis]|jgi:Ser/Thr protein kinase RdoA (MazF antagonist)|uniref:Ser/Thr protein kinase RdoA (MazF antagonist) n=1 Tax=Thermosporothrix hazakensis TaxID=644383 RepID=A0A326UFA1_THEHA|nr:phosphotransferase [Thermosporothrix hazakensis]PZW34384.1 Ser/Thr protein kinase RdoA (MazF antagonist) [Thermosporothrix hazakensis]GCE46066.1 hypothetical protein KTH_09350 [Thermosporothrix hazakensis]